MPFSTRFFFIFVLFLSKNALIRGQSDTVRLLPTAKIVTHRLDYFSIGQAHFESDSASISLFQRSRLANFLQSEGPLSIKTYGTGLASLSIRGMSSNHTAILWNGINLQNPLNGGLDLAIVGVGASQRVAVKLGGCSALCGSGAIGGTVAIDNTQPQQNGWHGQIGYGLGSTDWQNRFAQLTYSRPKMSASVQLASQNADNDFLFRNTAEIGKPLQRANPAAYNALNINANVFIQASNQDYVKVHFWNSVNYREITPTMTAASDNAIYRDTANRLTAEWTHIFKKSFIKIRGAYLYDKNAYASNTIKNSQNGIYSRIAEAEWNYNFSPRHFLRAGMNLTNDQSASSNYAQNHQRNRVALFINHAIVTDFATFTGNIRQEKMDETMTPTTFSLGFDKNLAKKTAFYALILRGSFSRNFNVPTFNDLYWANLGNPNLQNEQGWSKELGLSFKKETATQKLAVHATVFDIDLKNRIVWLPQTDGQWRPNNITQVQSKGVETWVNYRVNCPVWSYKLGANYQLAHATDGNGAVQLHTPVHKGGLNAGLQYRQFYAAYQQMASSKRYASTDKTTWAAPFTVADATLGFTPSVFGQKKGNKAINTDLSLNISNVFNADYQTVRFFPNAKRQYKLNFSILF
jgi:vitamin B12 transporter